MAHAARLLLLTPPWPGIRIWPGLCPLPRKRTLCYTVTLELRELLAAWGGGQGLWLPLSFPSPAWLLLLSEPHPSRGQAEKVEGGEGQQKARLKSKDRT